MSRDIAIYMLQIITISNAIAMGWKVTRINHRTYEISKKMSEIQNQDIDYWMTKFIKTNLYAGQ